MATKTWCFLQQNTTRNMYHAQEYSKTATFAINFYLTGAGHQPFNRDYGRRQDSILRSHDHA